MDAFLDRLKANLGRVFGGDDGRAGRGGAGGGSGGPSLGLILLAIFLIALWLSNRQREEQN